MAPPERIFRQAALDRLSSPEQLDQLMQVTTPKSWMALAAFGALLLTALIWGIFGKIDEQVHGRGIFLKSDGVFVVAAHGAGRVQELLAQHGDTVTNGQLLALITQPELEIKLHQAKTNYDGIEASLRALRLSQTNEQGIEEKEWSAQRSMLDRMITNNLAQIAALTNRAYVESKLHDRGLVSDFQRLDAQTALYAAQHDLYRAQVQTQELEMVKFQAKLRRGQLQSDHQDQLQKAQHEFESLSNSYLLNTEVRSPYSGQILEVVVNPGDIISAGTPITSLQSATNDLEARLFLSLADGKRLESHWHRAGGKSSSQSGPTNTALESMEAFLAPGSIKKEEYGLMKGEVAYVSAYPATPLGLLRILQNPILVAEFSQAGAPIEVTVRLSKNRWTKSGFVWTSGKGPRIEITSGTLCDGTITIDHRMPISLVLPLLRKNSRD